MLNLRTLCVFILLKREFSTSMRGIFLFLLLFVCNITLSSQTKLTGNIISSTPKSSSYAASNAFDGSTSTYFASNDSSYTWVGLDLGTSHVITKVGWAPRADYGSSTNLAIFEGANREDFADAIPIYMSTTDGITDSISYADINVTRGFRYVRYLGRNGSYCNVSEVEFYGIESEGNDSIYFQLTNLPLVVIHVDDGSEPIDKVNNLKAHFSVITKDGFKAVEDTGTVRLRGNTSMTFLKKPYRMKFASKHKLAGSNSKAKKWVLINNWDDKTLMRNNVGFELSRRVDMEYTPFSIPVDVMFNGEYKGTYELCDQVEIYKNRLDFDKIEPTTASGDSLTGAYLIENDGNAYLEDKWFFSNEYNEISIKYPDEDDITDIQFEYIKNHFNTMEAAVYSEDFTENGYRKYLDLESFLKYFIVEEFVANPDAFWSTFFYKKRSDDHFYTGPVWDFNLGFDNDYRTYHVSHNTSHDADGNRVQTWETSWAYNMSLDGEHFCAGDMENFVNHIIHNDTSAINRLTEMWAYLRASGLFSKESLNAYIDEQAEMLDQSQQLNFTRWDILNRSYLFHDPRARGSFEAEVEFIKEYSEERIDWMDWKLNCADTTFNISISDAEWSTLYLPISFPVPEEMKVYTISDYNGDTLSFNPVDITEANKPYLVNAPAGTYEIQGFTSVPVDSQVKGLLTGTIPGTTAPQDTYVLQKQSGRLGFYKVKDNESIKVGAQKAYLTLPIAESAAAPRRVVYYLDDETSGVNEINTTTDSCIRVYDLSGKLQKKFDNTNSINVENQILKQLGRGIYIVISGSETRKVVI